MCWIDAQDAEDLFISAITIMELDIGRRRVERRDQAQAARLAEWIETTVLVNFAGRVLPFDVAAARHCALLHVPDPRPERNAVIAATAAVHGMAVVTRNTADFATMGVALVNPWLHAPQ